jgi:hypothetical protein
MSVLAWDLVGDRNYTGGIDRGVIYPKGSPAVAWTGLVSVEESPTSDNEGYYFDGVKYFDFVAEEAFSAGVSAITYPEVLDYHFKEGHATRLGTKAWFDFSYRSLVNGSSSTYQIHLVYNAHLVVKDRAYPTTTASFEPLLFEWDLASSTMPCPGTKPTSHLVVDSRFTTPAALASLEKQLYGDTVSLPYMPRPAVVLELLKSVHGFAVVDNGDGTWTAVGTDAQIKMLNGTTFQITAPTITTIDANTYRITSD